MLFGIGGACLVRYKSTKYDPIYNLDMPKHNSSRFQGGNWNNGDLTVKDARTGGVHLRHDTEMVSHELRYGAYKYSIL